jgi:VCBS repeat protein/glycerophosphoryl diester phosphodiesterase family protein
MAVGGRAVAVAGLLLAASTVAAGLAPGMPALARATAAGKGQQAGPRSVATETEPLVGDFDGDRRADLLWYGPGAGEDHLWLGRPSRNFVGVPLTVRGSYQPLVGDYDGDRRADVLWYGPGGSPDVLWRGRPGGRFAARTLAVRGDYEPLVGDFDGDRRGDVLWYGPGARPDVLWLGRPGGRFAARVLTVRGSYQPLLGDFNGDTRRDVLWYGPGGDPDVLWLGGPGGRFRSRPLAVRGDYRPLVGDFNGDGPRDLLWHRPGPGADVVWFGHRSGRFSARQVAAPDGAEPFGGDFDGDGRRDVLWYGAGGAGDLVWYGAASSRFAPAAATVRGSYRPLVADFGGDGPDDVLWWAPGPAQDVLWFGRSSRRFTARWTTLDLDYQRAAAIRPEALAEAYDPYGFVAHAFGSIHGLAYTNSLEAFQRNYDRGFRVFECDQVLLADGTVLVAHDGLEANYGLAKPFKQATWADLAGHHYRGSLTILRSQDVLGLLAAHPDLYVIPDPKYGRPQIYRTYVRQAAAMGRLDLLERLMPHVADQAELDALRVWYPLRNYVLALYHSQAQNRLDDAAAVGFVRRNRTPAVMMWWRDRDPTLSLAANGRQGRRYRRSFAEALAAAGAITYVHSLADPAEIRRFQGLGIGVYSDEPFPPLDAGAATLQLPAFGPEASRPPA